jgi:hypothetical protein
LARHETEFTAEREVRIGSDSLLASKSSVLSNRERQDAIVCYLTRGDGWQDAFKRLGGAFAPDATTKQG